MGFKAVLINVHVAERCIAISERSSRQSALCAPCLLCECNPQTGCTVIFYIMCVGDDGQMKGVRCAHVYVLVNKADSDRRV